MDKMIATIERILEKPCYVIDMLPKQVPADSKGNFFAVEAYLLGHGGESRLREKFAGIVLRLMCYYPVSVFEYENGKLTEYPTPESVVSAVNEAGDILYLLCGEETLFVLEKDCLHFSVYNPGEDMKKLIADLSKSAGLFWRKADRRGNTLLSPGT